MSNNEQEIPEELKLNVDTDKVQAWDEIRTEYTNKEDTDPARPEFADDSPADERRSQVDENQDEHRADQSDTNQSEGSDNQ